MCSEPSYLGSQVEKSQSSPTKRKQKYRKNLHLLNHITTTDPEESKKNYTAWSNLLQLGEKNSFQSRVHSFSPALAVLSGRRNGDYIVLCSITVYGPKHWKYGVYRKWVEWCWLSFKLREHQQWMTEKDSEVRAGELSGCIVPWDFFFYIYNKKPLSLSSPHGLHSL